jgi:hypothetical protein
MSDGQNPAAVKSVSVLQDWVVNLSLAKQGVLLTGVRGPDNIRKDHPVKEFLRVYRRVILRCAKPFPNAFMVNSSVMSSGQVSALRQSPTLATRLSTELTKFWESYVDDLPHHFLMHFCHCAEVIAYDHPDPIVKAFWEEVYVAICHSFHMSCEDKDAYNNRLRDRGCY